VCRGAEKGTVRVLIVNWRDLDNPWAGGAEVHIHAVAEGLVERGHEVTLLASRFPGAATAGERRGVRIQRAGTWWNANFALQRAVRRELAERSYDVVVEDVNKIPFFTPRLHHLPTVVYVPHLFGSTVFRETNALFASYVWLMERPIPRVYRHATFIAISDSTRRDLIARGIAPERVHVVHCGLDFAAYDRADPPPRNAWPTLVHLGRLMRYKSADVAVRAMPSIRRRLPAARLQIVGDGPDRRRLEQLVRRLQLDAAVEFLGHVPHATKVDLLWRSHLLLAPSPKEGWGLIVVEANACGVPVVASRSPGLVDSVRDGETGRLVPYGDAEAMARASLEVLEDPALHARLAANARRWAASFRWADAALQTERILEQVVGEKQS
jgi:glycosyltransferase involved in cell wall biosynthesis